MTSPTRPEIKWLLVERATILGDIAQLEHRRAGINAELDALRQRADALATSLRILESHVSADAAGVVCRHQPGYCRRGALKEFILSAIRNSGTGLSSREIGLLTAAHFGLEFAQKRELHSYLDNTVRSTLKPLREAGVIESVPQDGAQILWRMKRQLPTLAELELQVGAAPPSGATDAQDTA